MGKLIGIDLGTTKSCVAVVTRGRPEVILNQEGERTTPSVVAFTAKGDRQVGQLAALQALINPENTVFGLMRLIGRRFASPEVQAVSRSLTCPLVEAPNGDVHVRIGDAVHSPPEILSILLQKLKAAAEDHLREPVTEAVVAHPALFDGAQRQAIRDAGLIADLNVSRLVKSTTAAAMSYGLGNPRGQFVAVYDLGGGTFSVTILEMADGLFQVRATAGDTFLGGEDFDQRVVDWLVAEVKRETKVDIRPEGKTLQRLKEAAEKAKCELSSVHEVEVVLPCISAAGPVGTHLNTFLTRQRYESLTEGLIERTLETSRRCLADANLRADEIDTVLLVGGQSRAPRVSEILRKVFAREPKHAVPPDEAPVLGAAIQGGVIQGQIKGVVLLDVASHSLGLEAEAGGFTRVIERNSPIPTRKSQVFTTTADDQTSFEVHVLKGEAELAKDNASLVRFELTGIPPAPKGTRQIEVSVEIDVNETVSVSAQDPLTGRSQSTVIRPPGGLSPQDVLRLVGDARAREASERSKKDRHAVLRQLDGFVANTLRAVQALESKLTPEEQEQILTALENAKKARTHSTLDELKARLGDMELAATLIGQALLRR